MNKLFNVYFKSDYLLRVAPETKYEPYFLYSAITVMILAIGIKLFFKFRGRSKAYVSFDRLWFWGYIVLSVVGLFVWFSRNQGLPIFGTRLASYLWLKSLFIYGVVLYFYYIKKARKDVLAHFNKERKAKYLKK